MTRPIQASLDLQALKQNLSIVRQAAPHARVWSVVKANANGHGIERIWSALGATDGFALLNLEEAITLRERGWKGPILMLEGFFHAQEEWPSFNAMLEGYYAEKDRAERLRTKSKELHKADLS